MASISSPDSNNLTLFGIPSQDLEDPACEGLELRVYGFDKPSEI